MIANFKRWTNSELDLRREAASASELAESMKGFHGYRVPTIDWDRTNGRLYRISWVESFKPVRVDLASQSDAELVALHGHSNEWFVRTARRLLQERAAAGRLVLATGRSQIALADQWTGTVNNKYRGNRTESGNGGN